MRFSFSLLGIALLVGHCLVANAFENLDFEDAMPVITGNISHDCCEQQFEDLLPHWSSQTFGNGVEDTSGAAVFYNYPHAGLDPPYIRIFDDLEFSTLGGKYTVHIESLGRRTDLFQTGIVPATAKSIQLSTQFFTIFDQSGWFLDAREVLPASDLNLYLGGEKLPLIELANTTSAYRTFGANLPAQLIGNQAELRFSVEPSLTFILDDIRFSPNRVPEPSTLALLLAGGCMFSPRRSGGRT